MHALPGPVRRVALLALAAGAAALPAQSPPRLADLHRVLPSGIALRKAAIADVTGDAWKDFVLFDGQRNAVWRDAGNCRFLSVPDAMGPTSLWFTDLALADLDGDGDRDCAVAVAADCDNDGPTCANGGDFVRWNDGTGRFTATAPTLPSNATVKSNAVAAGDVDGDGDQDLVFGCVPHVWSFPIFPPNWTLQGGENWLFLNNGTGTFTAANARLGTDRDATYDVLLADFDGDGDLDLYAANAPTMIFGGGQDAFYRNNGLGFFTRIATAVPAETDAAKTATALDVDGDQDLDVLLLTDLGGLRLLRNNGAGVFTDISANVPPVPPPTIPSFTQAFTADFDGNGTVDIGLLNNQVLLQLRNNGTGVFTHAPAFDRSGIYGVVTPHDLDGDSDVDVALLGRFGDVMLNDGTGALTAVPPEMPSTLANQLASAMVDIDLDGDRDVLASSTNSSNAIVYRNNGSGRFAPAAYGDFTTDFGETMGLAAGDLDGDGFADAVKANTIPPFIGGNVYAQIYRNDGLGRLDRVPTPAIDALSTALGDVDGDGDLDIFFGTYGADQVLRNQGNMVFQPILGAVSDSAATVSVALADLDGDLDLDGAIVGWSGIGCRVLRNDGTGVFTIVPGAVPAHADDSRHVLAADFDGDGDQDLAIANGSVGTPQQNRLYRNDGTGTFTENPADLPPGLVRTFSFTAADFDVDGDLDLIECSYGGPTRMLQNDGLGHFTVVAGGLPDVTTYAHQFAAGDFDCDGDLDAFLVTMGPPNLYWNLRRQIAWRELPRIARPLTMDLSGIAGDPYLLAAAAATTNLEIPGSGRLLIDLPSIFLLEFGALDAQGQSARSYLVPNDPAMVSATIYWQALVSAGALLSNREETTFRLP